jgi:hypothetical protein
MDQLRSEVTEHSDISFQISAHSVTVRLGDETKIDAHRYGFNNEFCVEVTSWYKYPEPEVVEQTRKFETAEAAVEFIVPICARHIAGKV